MLSYVIRRTQALGFIAGQVNSSSLCQAGSALPATFHSDARVRQCHTGHAAVRCYLVVVKMIAAGRAECRRGRVPGGGEAEYEYPYAGIMYRHRHSAIPFCGMWRSYNIEMKWWLG